MTVYDLQTEGNYLVDMILSACLDAKFKYIFQDDCL